MEKKMNKFEIGKTYYARSICNHDCIFSFMVTKRTEKTITINGGIEGIKTIKIRIVDGIETAMPLGRYSMAPVIRANRIAA